jgi:hypothetical protein
MRQVQHPATPSLSWGHGSTEAWVLKEGECATTGSERMVGNTEVAGIADGGISTASRLPLLMS